MLPLWCDAWQIIWRISLSHTQELSAKSRFLEVLSTPWWVQTLLLSEEACFPVTFLIRLLLEHSISISSYHSTHRRVGLVSVMLWSTLLAQDFQFNLNCQIPAQSASSYHSSSPKASLPPGLQQPAAVRLVHNYRYAAQGLSPYSARLLLCVFAENYASLY